MWRFFAHLLLAKEHGGKLWHAVNGMLSGAELGARAADPSFRTRARRHYAAVKAEFGRIHSARMKGAFTGDRHPMFGRPCSPVALAKLKARLAAGFNPMASAEARAKVSAALTGRERSPEWRERLAASRRGKPLPQKTREAMSRAHTGKSVPPETVAKVAEALRGRPKSPEHVEKMRAALTGRKLSPEHVEKLRRPVPHNPRFRGRTHSPETKARMSAVNKARRAYASANRCDARKVTLQMLRAAGVEV